MVSGTKVTEITQITDLTGVNDVYVKKGNNFCRISLEAFFAGAEPAKLTVTVTQSGSTYSANKTFSEMWTAHNTDKKTVSVEMGEAEFVLSSANPSGMAFTSLSVVSGVTTIKILSVDDNNDWTYQEASGGGGSGFTEEFKQALLNAVENVAWKDVDGREFVDALEAAMYPLSYITAVYTQSGTVYDTDSLDSLKAYLVVTAFYQGGGNKVVTDYTLSGTLTEGTSTITVSYGGKTASFSVSVTKNSSYVSDGLLAHWDAIDNTGNGHDATQLNWVDLVDGHTLTPLATPATISVGENCYVFSPAAVGNSVPNNYNVLVTPHFGETKTVEIVFEYDTSNTAGCCFGFFTGQDSLPKAQQHLVAYSVSKNAVTFYNDTADGSYSVPNIGDAHSFSATYGDGCVGYINGQPATRSSITNSWSTSGSSGYNRIIVGGSASFSFKGKIYSIRLYNRVLSASEIARNHSVDVDRFGLE